MKKIKNLFKNFDIFGKPLYLNFDKQWDSYPTSCGGFSTVILISFVLFYCGYLLSVMIYYG